MGLLTADHLAPSFYFTDAIRRDSGLWKYYVLFLPSGDCTNSRKKKKKKEKKAQAAAPHRVSSQNAKFYHSAQVDSVFQVREQSEVPFSTFSATSLKMI